MVKRLQMLFVFLCMFVGVTLAQVTTVTGTVISDEDGEPVIGASVLVKGTSVGAVTNIDGQFTINNVPTSATTLVVSYVGMETQEVRIARNVTVRLKSDSYLLQEVVVQVAYGTAKKTSLTGAIQEVKSEALELRPTSSVASALEGSISGVQVNTSYGNPGSDPSIRIRGIGTVNGSSSPLYVIDGVPFGGNISDLNPADIESMSVLKDAASAALYGNRASNGVILITTKKGKSGRLNVSLDIKQGTYSRGIKEYKRLNDRQFMEMEWQNLKNSRISNNGEDAATAAAYASKNLIDDMLYLNIYNKADDQLFDANGKLVSDAQILSGYTDDLDWYDAAVRNGYRQEYNFSANGANDKSDYLFSLGYLDENGYLTNSGYDRLSARVSVNTQAKKWLKTGLNLNATHQNYTNTNGVGSGSGSYTNVFMYARNIAPIYPIHLHDVKTGNYILDANDNIQYDGGSYKDADGNVINTRNQYVDRHVIWENELNSDKTIRNTVNGIAFADIILPYNFTFTLKGNMNLRQSYNQTYNSAVIGDGKGNNGRGKREEYRYKNYTFQQQLHWNHDYGKHLIDVLAGHENYYYNYNYMYGYKTNEVFAGAGYLRNFTEITSFYDYNVNYRTESYLGRVRYAYDDRYNVEASFRRDGSSRFAKDARWGNFWSIGGNWVISGEEFMKDVKWVDYLKLRADYGEVGNDAGAGYFGYMALYSSSQNANKGAYYISQLPNYDLKWETGQSWGIGVEARLFNRLNVEIEYFNKRNKDLLFDVYNPLSAGATSNSYGESVITRNLGTIANYGWEFTADVDVFKNRDWRINIGANATLLKNEVKKLPEQNKDGIISGNHKIVEGKDRYAWYTYTFRGIDTNNGYSLYDFNDEDYFFTQDGVTYGNTEGSEIKDSNLDHVVVIDGVPYTYRATTYGKKDFHGSAIPDVYGSFNFNISYKSLALTTLFTYQLGGKVMDSNYSSLMGAGSSPASFHQNVLSSWTTDDATEEHAINPTGTPVIDYNMSTYVNTTSSRWLTDASYLVLKNIALTYQLPKEWVKKIDLEGIGVSVACENAITWTKRRGMSPQQSFTGSQDAYLVPARVFTVGLNVKF